MRCAVHSLWEDEPHGAPKIIQYELGTILALYSLRRIGKDKDQLRDDEFVLLIRKLNSDAPCPVLALFSGARAGNINTN
jgi:hypothetical protein